MPIFLVLVNIIFSIGYHSHFNRYPGPTHSLKRENFVQNRNSYGVVECNMKEPIHHCSYAPRVFDSVLGIEPN